MPARRIFTQTLYLTLLSSVLGTAQTAAAANRSYIGPTGGSWTDPANWSAHVYRLVDRRQHRKCLLHPERRRGELLRTIRWQALPWIQRWILRYADGDFNSDGLIDGADFDQWFTHLQSTFGGFASSNLESQILSSVSSVPGPASLSLFALAVLPLLRRRQRS